MLSLVTLAMGVTHGFFPNADASCIVHALRPRPKRVSPTQPEILSIHEMNMFHNVRHALKDPHSGVVVQYTETGCNVFVVHAYAGEAKAVACMWSTTGRDRKELLIERAQDWWGSVEANELQVEDAVV